MNDNPYILNKPLPSIPDAERIVIGAILIDNDLIADAAEHLTADDFYSPTNREVFGAMLKLFHAGQPISPILIGEEIKKRGKDLETFGGFPAVVNYTFGLPRFNKIDEYVSTVLDYSLNRQIVRQCSDIQSRVLDGAEAAEDSLDYAEQSIGALRRRNNNGATEISEIVVASFNNAKARFESGAKVLGIQTGFIEIDQMTSGLQKQEWTVIAARPSIGKTALMLNICDKATDKDGNLVVVIFSMEMSKDALVTRLMCSRAKVDSQRYKLGDLSKDEWERMSVAAAEIANKNIVIDDTARLNTVQMKAKLRQVLRKKKRLDLVLVDYLGIMGGVKNNQSRFDEVSQNARDQKALAKEFDVPVITLSQLSRKCESRTPPRPIMSDLRESGDIEQEADNIGLLYREDYYTPSEENAGQAELIWAKNRNGATGVIKLAFQKHFTLFQNYYKS